jgi:hypothetical protein
MWNKLEEKEFSTFRYNRKDRDWELGEAVQVYFHNRSKDRKFLGIARIAAKERRNLDPSRIQFSPLEFAIAVNDAEAVADGFKDRNDMVRWFRKTYGKSASPIMNRLSLVWVSKV